MIIKTEMRWELGPISPQKYRVDKVVELPYDLFSTFLIRPEEHYEFIEQNKVRAYGYGVNLHCLLALRKGYADGVLIQCGDGGHACRIAYVPDARDVIQAKLDRAVDFIVQQGTEHTASGNWRVCWDELDEKFGVAIQEGNGLDAMLKDTLERRPEVAQAEVSLQHIETEFHPEFCPQLHGGAEEKKAGIRVRDILPLLTGGGLTFLTHEDADTSVLAENLCALTNAGREDYAGLLNARVTEIASSSEGTEVVLTDVDPEELVRFNRALETFEAAEQAMGGMTP